MNKGCVLYARKYGILEWIQALYATKLNEYICIAVKASVSREYLVFTKRKNTTIKLGVHPFLVM